MAPTPKQIAARIAVLAPTYLARRLEDVEALSRAHAVGDLEQIVSIGHNLRGTGASYGYGWISEIGARLESLGPQGSTEIPMLIQELRERLEEARKSLQTGQRKR